MAQKIDTHLREDAKRALLYLRTLVKWAALAVVIGVLCGVIGSVFHIGVHEATHLRAHHPWLLWCLPVAGLAIVGFYKLTKTEGLGTNAVLDAVHLGKPLSIFLLPAIFIGTVLTHLCGGSAGREGAALQMGGTIGHHTGRLFRLDDRDQRTATLAGMAAYFAALFGTPLTATVFSMEVVSIGIFHYSAFFPCLLSGLAASAVTRLLGVAPESYPFQGAPEGLEWNSMLLTGVLGILCALAAILFCVLMHQVTHLYQKLLPNQYARVVVGAALVILLTVIEGSGDYNGSGTHIIHSALMGNVNVPWAFLLKMVFTALTLGAGFRGGEIVPTLFIGATLGCAVGPMLGLTPAFAAAICMIALFCGVVNCPMASILLSVELFGSSHILFFALACALSYMLSGKFSLYSSQKIVYSKLEPQFIDADTH